MPPPSPSQPAGDHRAFSLNPSPGLAGGSSGVQCDRGACAARGGRGRGRGGGGDYALSAAREADAPPLDAWEVDL
eukprot:1639700-Prymnesium_polylepis.1